MGAAAAGIIPLSMAWIGDQVAYDRRQETLAKLMGYTVSGMMVGLWFGGFAAEHLGWRTAFAVVSGLFAVAAWMLWRKLRTTPATVPASGSGSFLAYFSNSVQMLRTARVRHVMTVTAIEGAVVFGAMAFIPTHLHQQFDMSVVLAGSVMMLYGVGGLAGSVAWSEQAWSALRWDCSRWHGRMPQPWACWVVSPPGLAFTCSTTLCRFRPPKWHRPRGALRSRCLHVLFSLANRPVWC
jgi:predicted MFS family arabinose efflux permease